MQIVERMGSRKKLIMEVKSKAVRISLRDIKEKEDCRGRPIVLLCDGERKGKKVDPGSDFQGTE